MPHEKGLSALRRQRRGFCQRRAVFALFWSRTIYDLLTIVMLGQTKGAHFGTVYKKTQMPARKFVKFIGGNLGGF
jgi:hypothetical protein